MFPNLAMWLLMPILLTAFNLLLPLLVIVVVVMSLLATPAAAAELSKIDYFAAVGLSAGERTDTAAGDSELVRSEQIKLGTRPVTYGGVPDYMNMVQLLPTQDCPDGTCPLQQPAAPQAVYYAAAPAEIDAEPYVGCGVEAYAESGGGCGGEDYATAPAAVQAACGSAAYARTERATARADRRQARWDRRKARRESRAALRAHATGPIRRLLRGC